MTSDQNEHNQNEHNIEGIGALHAWLEDRGVKNIQMLNEVVAKGAKPWWSAYGGKENIEVVG